MRCTNCISQRAGSIRCIATGKQAKEQLPKTLSKGISVLLAHSDGSDEFSITSEREYPVHNFDFSSHQPQTVNKNSITVFHRVHIVFLSKKQQNLCHQFSISIHEKRTVINFLIYNMLYRLTEISQ